VPHEPSAGSPGLAYRVDPDGVRATLADVRSRPIGASAVPDALQSAADRIQAVDAMSEQTQTITSTETLTWPPKERRGSRSPGSTTGLGTASSPAAPFTIPGSTR
jgi:hypothetical protein